MEAETTSVRACAPLVACDPTPPSPAVPPKLITTKNASYLGLSSGKLLTVLRAMRRDPAFADSVIVAGKTRAASPDAIERWLRAQTPRAA